MTRASAVAVALLVHLVQALWTVAGFGALVFAGATPAALSRARQPVLATSPSA